MLISLLLFNPLACFSVPLIPLTYAVFRQLCMTEALGAQLPCSEAAWSVLTIQQQWPVHALKCQLIPACHQQCKVSASKPLTLKRFKSVFSM